MHEFMLEYFTFKYYFHFFIISDFSFLHIFCRYCNKAAELFRQVMQFRYVQIKSPC